MIRKILLVILTIGCVAHAKSNITLESIAQDVTNMYIFFESVILIPRFARLVVTPETVKKNILNFEPLTWDELRKANLGNLGSELAEITKKLSEECGPPNDCELISNWTKGVEAFDELGRMMSVVQKTPNLDRIFRIKNIMENEFKNTSLLMEMADALDDLKNYPKSASSENRAFVAKIAARLPKIASMARAFQELMRTTASFSKDDIATELEALVKLKAKTQLIAIQQNAIHRLKASNIDLRKKMKKILNNDSMFKSILEKMKALEILQSSPRPNNDFQYLELVDDGIITPRMLFLTKIPKTELIKILAPAKLMKAESATWRSQRSMMEIPDGFAEKFDRVRGALRGIYSKIVDMVSSSKLENCIARISLKPFDLISSDENAGLVEEMRLNLSGTTDTFLEELKRLGVDKSDESTMAKWKQYNVVGITASLRDMKASVGKFNKFRNDSSMELDSWKRDTGIANWRDCSIETTRMKSLGVVQSELLGANDSDVNQVVGFANRFAGEIVKITSETRKNISMPYVRLPFFLTIAETVQDLRDMAKHLRVLVEVHRYDKEIRFVFHEMNAHVESADPHRFEEVWTSETIDCVNRTINGTLRVQTTLASLGSDKRMADWQTLLEELKEMGSCRAGLVFKQLMEMAKDGELKQTLDLLQHVDLTFSPPYYPRAIPYETTVFFSTFERELKDWAIEKQEEEERKKRGPPPPGSEPWSDIATFSAMAVSAAVLPFMAGAVLHHYGFM